MPATVVCISHLTGARGPDIARAVATRLGFSCVDEEIVARAAEKEGLKTAEVADAERRRSSVRSAPSPRASDSADTSRPFRAGRRKRDKGISRSSKEA